MEKLLSVRMPFPFLLSLVLRNYSGLFLLRRLWRRGARRVAGTPSAPPRGLAGPLEPMLISYHSLKDIFHSYPTYPNMTELLSHNTVRRQHFAT